MPYSHTAADGRTHYLHSEIVAYPDGHQETIYWFARALQIRKAVATLPVGYRVRESAVTHRPQFRRT
jgi:hypothetical protein